MMKKRMIFFLPFLLLIMKGQQCSAQETDKPGQVKNVLGQNLDREAFEAFLTKTMEELKVPGISLAIIHEAEVVYKLATGYANMETGEKVNAQSIFEGASLSKPLFAYFVLMYVEEGLLRLDRPLFEYLPYEDIAHDERYKKITARMVLSHTSGFPNWRGEAEGDKLFLQFEPGTSFAYSGEGYQYLAKVLAKLLNTDDKGLEEKFQEKVARPFNLLYTKFMQDDYNRENKVQAHREGEKIAWEENPVEFGAAYSVHTEAGDFAKWMIALLEKKGLEAASFERLFSPQVQIPKDDPNRQAGVRDWTLGFAKATLPYGTFYAHGGNNPGFSSLFAINLEKKWGIVLFTNADQSPLGLHILSYLHAQK